MFAVESSHSFGKSDIGFSAAFSPGRLYAAWLPAANVKSHNFIAACLPGGNAGFGWLTLGCAPSCFMEPVEGLPSVLPYSAQLLRAVRPS